MLTDDTLHFAVTLFAVLGCGLMAGIFFVFSNFVMKSLSRLSPAEGMTAMQFINVDILNPAFFIIFLGTAAACIFLVIATLSRWPDPAAVYLLVGGSVYVFGCLLVTMIFNVPRNNALASVTPTDPNSEGLWASYLTRWTAWNHVRAVAVLGAAALLSIGLCY